MFSRLARASGLPVFQEEPKPKIAEAQVASAGWRWHGQIVLRVWDAEMTEQDILEMRYGVRRSRTPDAIGPVGQKIFFVSEREKDEGERILDAACLARLGERRKEFRNLACNAGRTALLNFIASAGGSTGITYFAVGTGTAAPLATDTQLGNEVFRKAVSSTTVSGNQILISTFFLAAEGNFSYTEAGPFGGTGASGTANSGTLYAHAPYVYTKTSAVALTNDYFIFLA